MENKGGKADEKRKLTEEQENVVNKTENTINNNEYKEFLIYGVTGSRKN